LMCVVRKMTQNFKKMNNEIKHITELSKNCVFLVSRVCVTCHEPVKTDYRRVHDMVKAIRAHGGKKHIMVVLQGNTRWALLQHMWRADMLGRDFPQYAFFHKNKWYESAEKLAAEIDKKGKKSEENNYRSR
jgi:hypothetical protein